MYEFIVNFYEVVSPYVLAFGPFIMVWGGYIVMRLCDCSDAELERNMHNYFERRHIEYMKRQRRKAYWRLLKYKFSKRRTKGD